MKDTAQIKFTIPDGPPEKQVEQIKRVFVPARAKLIG